jgi:hypothetical protein
MLALSRAMCFLIAILSLNTSARSVKMLWTMERKTFSLNSEERVRLF